MEALYARMRRERTIDEAATFWGVSRDILVRFVFSAPTEANAKQLAWDFLDPEPDWQFHEFLDMHEGVPPWTTTGEYASLFEYNYGPSDLEPHIVREFAVYAEHHVAASPDTLLSEKATAAHYSLTTVSAEIKKKRKTSRPSKHLRNIQSRIDAQSLEPPSFRRECILAELWSEVAAITGRQALYDAEDVVSEDLSVTAHRKRMADPVSLVRILGEVIDRRPTERRKAVWEADGLLRQHYWELLGLPARGALGEHRDGYRRFSSQLCSLHGLPAFSDHVERRRKK